ncbi:hypothetical protein ACFL6C_13805, partial [Myxococcota bacterium]
MRPIPSSRPLGVALVLATMAVPACRGQVNIGSPVCGNSTKEAPEICDGSDLGGRTCANLGFDDGTLDCTSTCDAFDFSGCTHGAQCGNSEIEPPEACDGNDLDGEDCTDHGFGSGTLACASTCDAFDLSGCSDLLTCGNDVIDAPEVCDGADLDAQDCTDFDYVGGTLGCASDCMSFDLSECVSSSTCGNNEIELPELCDGSDLGGIDCRTFGFTVGELTCLPNCSQFDVSGCLDGRPCIDSLDCPVTARRCDPVLLLCVECLDDNDCSCHEVCEDRSCMAIGGQLPEDALHAHGTWASTPGQPDYAYEGSCGSDAGCESDQLCNPFTAGCVPVSASSPCTAGACPGGSLCDSRTDQCFPAALCLQDRNCCGATDVVCVTGDGDSGLCYPIECTPPEELTSTCPLEPKVTDECPGEEFCSGTGQCVECVCDADCSDVDLPRCDELRGECVRDDFCRSPDDCTTGLSCDRPAYTCTPSCTASNECSTGESCDPNDHVCRCQPDDHEPNDSVDAPLLPELPIPAEGSEIGFEGTLCDLDEDWLTMALESGNRIEIVGVGAAELTAIFEVYGSDQTTLIAWGQISISSMIPLTFAASESGTYYLRLAPWDGT